MTPTAVIQTKQGIGDTIWHLPFIRAIAAASPGGKVTFFTLPSSHAAEFLSAESCIARIVYYENRGSEITRGLHLLRFIGLLRRERFDTVWILEKSVRPALAAWVARIPNRIGPGLGPQSPFISNAGIDRRHQYDMTVEYMTALLKAIGVPLATTEPNLQLPAEPIATVRGRYAGKARPWIVLALSGSHPAKAWPDPYWIEFIAAVRARTPGTVFIIGGADQHARADALIAQTSGAVAVNACDLSIVEAAALLRESDLFVGPDSGPMNLAAAVGTPAFGLFGATIVLSYSKFIHPIVPPSGKFDPDGGMLQILPARVIELVAPHLTVTKATPAGDTISLQQAPSR